MPTNISWATETWNWGPGCKITSEGCGMPRPDSDDPDAPSCYALHQAHMRASNPNEKIARAYAGLTHRREDGRIDWTGKVNLLPERIEIPYHWRKPRHVFVNSMGDTFNKLVPVEFLARAFAVMAATPQHTYMIPTKQHARMRSVIQADPQNLLEHLDERSAQALYDAPWPLPNVWLGVSVETQRWFDNRWAALRETPAAVRWISAEPLLGRIQMCRCDGGVYQVGRHPSLVHPECPLHGDVRLNWVVGGGESGPTARPMHPGWIRYLRAQCQVADIAFHFKQWGEWAPAGLGIGVAPSNVGREILVGPRLDDMGHREVMRRVGRGAAGRKLDGREWDEYPEVVPA